MGRFLERAGDGYSCYLYGCQAEEGTRDRCDCGYRAIRRSLLERFGEDLIAQADLAAELSQESPGLDPSLPHVLYEAVLVYRAEIGKYEHLRATQMRKQHRGQ